jgi:hypothetical protein
MKNEETRAGTTTALKTRPGPLKNPIPGKLRWDTHWVYAVIFFGLQAIVQFPIFNNFLPMLVDYPNHLARMHILLAAGSLADLNKFYEIHWAALPNLAMDLIVPILASFVGLELAGKLFLGSTLLLISSGTCAIHILLHRRISLWPFTVFLFLYNPIFLFGVVNYLFGIGVGLWGMAAWILLSRTPRWWHFFFFSFVSIFLLLCHLSAFGFYALVVTLYEMRRTAHSAKGASSKDAKYILAASLVFPILAFVMVSPTSEMKKFDWLGLSLFQYAAVTLLSKITLLFSFFLNYDKVLDFISSVVVGVFITCGMYSGYLIVHRSMMLPLACGGIVVLLMPTQLFGSSLADSRILVALAFVFIASTDWAARTPQLLRSLLACLFVGLFLVRIIVILNYWKEADILTAHAIRALNEMPKGKRLFVAFPEEKTHQFSSGFGKYLPCMAIISRSAFVPSLYALPGAQPVALTPRFQLIKAHMPETEIRSGDSPDWAQVLQDYDYVWVAEHAKFASFPSKNLSIVASNAHFDLYEVIKNNH